MTDEQAALIAAATAFGARRSPAHMSSDDLNELADAIATLTRSIFLDLRELSDQREHVDLLERLGQLTSTINR